MIVEILICQKIGNTTKKRKAQLTVGHTGLEIGRRWEMLGTKDTGISKTHLMLFANETELMFVDLGSKNGTYCNRKRIDRAKLTVGSCLKIGQTKITVLRILPEPSMDELLAGVPDWMHVR